MTTEETIKSLFENKIFLSTLSSLIMAQFLKMVFFLLPRKNRKKPWDAVETMIWRTGGMPSSHSAIVCSLAASIGLYEGFSSNIFIVCLIFAMVVLRDSMGVRRAAGLQAKSLNNLGKFSAEKLGVEFKAVKEIQGHTPPEVLVGALLGICTSLIYFII